MFLVSLLTDDKRCLHDILAGVIVMRRPYVSPRFFYAVAPEGLDFTNRADRKPTPEAELG